MDKINLGATIPAYPMPVALVGTHVNNKPNFMTVAWFSMAGSKPPKIAMVLGNNHYTNVGIKENQIASLCNRSLAEPPLMGPPNRNVRL